MKICNPGLPGLVVLACCAAAPGQAQSYKGIYVVAVPNVDGSKAAHAEASAYKKPFIDGLMIPLHWAYIEPVAPGNTLAPGAGLTNPYTGEVFCPHGTHKTNYCWQELDEQLRLADPTKALSLAVVAGGYTPAWLATDSAYAVATAGPVLYASHNGTGSICYTISLPLASSNAALANGAPSSFAGAYVAMIQALAAHLQQVGALSLVSMIKVSGGINNVTEEFHLDSATTSASCLTSTTLLWSSLGYTPAATQTAWTYMAQGMAASFPGALLSFDILENSFSTTPLITDGGVVFTVAQYNANPAAYGTLLLDRVLAALVPGGGAQGVLGPAPVAIQWNGLAPSDQQNLSTIATHTLAAGAAGAVIGWQTNELYAAQGSGCGTAACASATSMATTCYGTATCAAEYASMLDNGITPVPGGTAHGSYVEVWPADVVNACLQPALVAGHNALTGASLTLKSKCQ